MTSQFVHCLETLKHAVAVTLGRLTLHWPRAGRVIHLYAHAGTGPRDDFDG